MKKDALTDAGINYDEGVHRFAGNERLYEKYLIKFFDLDVMCELGAAIEGNSYGAAFRIAHNLKSTCGNISISTLYKTVCELVEALRGGNCDAARIEALFAQACAQYDMAKRAALEGV